MFRLSSREIIIPAGKLNSIELFIEMFH